jgi:phosphatidylglycerophosphate synthase
VSQVSTGPVSMEQVRATYKRRDAWWTVLLVDPLASRVVRVVAGKAWVTPGRLTATAFVLGLAAAAAFLRATPAALALGAALYYASFFVDCMDGKIARLRGTGSLVGRWLDFLLDRLRGFIATVALFGGLFLATDDPVYLLAATVVTFLSLFGYLNGAETDKVRARMAARTGAPSPNGFHLPAPVADLRAQLHRHRIRMNLVSGVEFEMALFVVAPLVAAATNPAAILWVGGVAAALLIAFELAMMTRFWVTARSHDRG